MSFEVIVYQLLKACNIVVSKAYLTERIKAHPDYPSLASLTDLLDEWELDYSALQLEPSDLSQMEYPFLAHVVTNEGMEDFEIVQSADQLNKDRERFLHAWTGIVVWVASSQSITSEDHKTSLLSERNNRNALWVISSLILITLGLSYVWSYSLLSIGYALFSIAGIIVSGAIAGYTMGVDNGISRSFCQVGASGCQKIINSKFSQLLPQVHLSDLALVYFTGLLLVQTFATGYQTQVISTLFLIPSVLAVLATLITLGYQTIKGEWCKLCLLLTGVIWGQAILLFSSLSFPLELAADPSFLSWSLLAFALAGSWIVIKPYVIKSQKVDSQNVTMRKWRQNPTWFNALLQVHKAIDRNIWTKEIFYGNPQGILQITLATGPYCHPCSIAHARLEHIFSRYPDDIGVKIRFVIKESKIKDKEATMAVLNTYQRLIWQQGDSPDSAQNPLAEEIIKYWFQHQDLELFDEQYPPSDETSPGMESLLRQHIQWGKQFGIDQTPGFFVNGHEMPNPHTLVDLNIFLDSYIELLKPTTQVFEIPDPSNQSLS